MIRLIRWARTLENAALTRFTNWFCSGGGVMETFFVVLAIAIVEQARPSLDPHGFWLLWALTIYSGITQPALAYAGTQAARRGDEHARMLDERLARIEAHLGIKEASA